MIFDIVGTCIGALILGGGLYYWIKEKEDGESRKIYGITTGVGALIVVGMLIQIGL